MTDFSKNAQTSKFMKIRYMGVELFHAEGQTNMAMLAVTFCNFANRTKNCPTVWVKFILCCIVSDLLLKYNGFLSFSRSVCCE
jgi:hypothetical protein